MDGADEAGSAQLGGVLTRVGADVENSVQAELVEEDRPLTRQKPAVHGDSDAEAPQHEGEDELVGV